MIVGIDEVGRGSWAGPLVAGAVVLKRPILGLKDSKQLTKVHREQLDSRIREVALAVGVGQVSPREIDQLGLTAAITLAMERALAEITVRYKAIVIDGNYNFLRHNPLARSLTKADMFIAAVSAASIVAKVARDRLMVDMSQRFPGYAFESNVGYGTRTHRLAIEKLGATELHRLSFKPLRERLL